MIEIKECLVVDGRFYTTGDIVEVVTDGGVECNFLERYVGRIIEINKFQQKITLDTSDMYNAEKSIINTKYIKDVLIHAPSLMQSEPQSDSTEKKHGKSLFRFLHKD
jgi:hypothetical protein